MGTTPLDVAVADLLEGAVRTVRPSMSLHRAAEELAADAIGLLVKAGGADEMTGLIEAQPELYYWPKYYGASGWLGLKLNRPDTDWDQVRDWLERSWRAAAPPRLTKLMRAADEF